MLLEASPRVGDAVTRGSPLLRLSTGQASVQVRVRQAELEEAQASVRLQERQLDGLRRDHEAGGEALNTLQDAEGRLQVERSRRDRAQAELEAARVLLRQHVLVAPISGTVVERHVNPGELLQVGVPAYAIASTSDMEILVKVDPSEARSIRVGMDVAISTDDAPDTAWQEKVIRIEPAVRKENNADYLPVWVSAISKTLKLVPNQQVDARFSTASRQATVRLPLEALVSKNGGDQVWLVRHGRLALTPVTVGILGDRYVQIQSGLQAGDTAALLDGKPFKNGDPVKLSPAGSTR